MSVGVFSYNNIEYKYLKSDDPSTYGCVVEIVNQDEYVLSKWNNMIDKHFIDIGANCGIATIILAKQNPRSMIYSFEPDTNVFQKLKANIELNELTNVFIYNKAVCRAGVKTIDLCFHPDYSGGNSTCSDINSMGLQFNTPIKKNIVECISLDEIIRENSIKDVELLKIDCEGAEYEIIYESNCIRTGSIKNLVGEFHNLSYNTKITNPQYNGNSLLIYCREYIVGIVKVFVLNI